jgi:3-phenylpropionate/cinnamic acid dioxygenase small subunit
MTATSIDANDIIEIQQLLARYGHAIDDRDWDTFRSLFLPHAVLDYTPARAPSVCNGIDEIMEYFGPANHPSAHHVTNIVVEPAADIDGMRAATVRSKWFAPYTRNSHDPKRWAGGTYLDVVVHTATGWRFARKECQPTWQFTPEGQGDVAEHRRTY